MPELREGFYWSKNNYGTDNLVYYSRSVLKRDGLVLVNLFDERGVYGSVITSLTGLKPFDLNKDLERLNPKTAERVRKELEERVE